jgi:hypothetical protein
MPDLIVERRAMRRTTAWIYRCPAWHQLVVTVQGRREPVTHRVLFEAEHVNCKKRTEPNLAAEAVANVAV